ncbi:hypothetical protein CFAM422_010041 [Trichoderma lentiforme]|uniref:Uncharacterized protein n=1 Tax=Trichoderma lentiforme TaxID=1567552 RepID=A0A9P5C8H8_9HYPO|nr:hypothetical protein CFAM422_010041 [Trichoderma lentiforme]
MPWALLRDPALRSPAGPLDSSSMDSGLGSGLLDSSTLAAAPSASRQRALGFTALAEVPMLSPARVLCWFCAANGAVTDLLEKPLHQLGGPAIPSGYLLKHLDGVPKTTQRRPITSGIRRASRWLHWDSSQLKPKTEC